MPDLHEELGRLADAVGEPVTFGELDVTRRRGERRRRIEALAVGIAVIALVAVFLATAFRAEPSTAPGGDTAPTAPPSVAAPSGAGPSTIAGLCNSRLGWALVVEEDAPAPGGHFLTGCLFWPAGKAFTITFESSAPGSRLQLFSARQCASGPCVGDPVWSAPTAARRMSQTYRMPALHPGQYMLIDRVNLARKAITAVHL